MLFTSKNFVFSDFTRNFFFLLQKIMGRLTPPSPALKTGDHDREQRGVREDS